MPSKHATMSNVHYENMTSHVRHSERGSVVSDCLVARAKQEYGMTVMMGESRALTDMDGSRLAIEVARSIALW